MIDHLEIARDPMRSQFVRLDEWKHYEAEQWAQAVTERGLPMGAVPKEVAYCRDMGFRITTLLETQLNFRVQLRESAPTAHVGTS